MQRVVRWKGGAYTDKRRERKKGKTKVKKRREPRRERRKARIGITSIERVAAPLQRSISHSCPPGHPEPTAATASSKQRERENKKKRGLESCDARKASASTTDKHHSHQLSSCRVGFLASLCSCCCTPRLSFTLFRVLGQCLANVFPDDRKMHEQLNLVETATKARHERETDQRMGERGKRSIVGDAEAVPSAQSSPAPQSCLRSLDCE